MTSRRLFLSAALSAAAFGFMGMPCRAQAAQPGWSLAALDLARPAANAVIEHPFVRGVFEGTLPKKAFWRYLTQNVAYLENYARVLDLIASRLKGQSGLEGKAADFGAWAKETRDLRTWTMDYAANFSDRPIEPGIFKAAAETQTYMNFESHYAGHESLGCAVAAMLPCFWIYDEFGRALRPKAKEDGNPFRDWFDAMGSEAGAASTKRIVAVADALALKETPERRRQMAEIFIAGCWYEWTLFDAALR